MFRKIFLSILLVSGVYHASALSPIKFGVKAGLDWQTVNLGNAKLGPYVLSADPRTGYFAAIMARASFVGVSIQPELVYSYNSYKLEAYSSDANAASTVKMSSFEVPVMVGFKVLFLRGEAGPVFHLSNSTSTTGPLDIETVIPSVGYAVGLGATFGKLDLSVRYKNNFSKSDQSIKIGDSQAYGMKTGFGGWMLSIGIFF